MAEDRQGGSLTRKVEDSPTNTWNEDSSLVTDHDVQGQAIPFSIITLQWRIRTRRLLSELNHNSTLLERFEAIQDRTMVAGTADEETYEQCRDEFENTYYRLVGAIRRRIQSSQASATSSNARHLQLAFASSATSETPLPQFHGYQGEWGCFRDSFESFNSERVLKQSRSLLLPNELLRGRYEDDDDDDNKLNNRHYWQQQQHRGAVHRTDEVSTAKPNLLSPTLDGGAGLIGIKLDLLTNPLTNISNGKLLINNDAHETSRDVEERDTKDETAKAGLEVTHGIQDIVTSIDTTTFLTPANRRTSRTVINETRPVRRTVSMAAAHRQYSA
ncbi:hypothetical protein K0M31_001951 [Melipona bicolor]|uniref:Uncharacterized protein n=1 Tax=Melipona bicolor TaxID=60889 RepID=A0AA40GGI7_9HYME|nr:hypothetical protein K0M31_001951 [Melipona bicolor]